MASMSLWKLFRESITEWQRDKASKLAASTAYYTVFSIAPLLIIVIGIVGLLLQRSEVEAYLLQEVGSLVGPDGMGAVASMLDAASRTRDSMWASIIGFATLLLGASGLMLSLQDSFNHIWKIETHPHTNTIVIIILKRLFSFGMILTLGFLLLVSLVLSAVVSVVVAYLSRELPTIAVVLPIVHTLLSLLTFTALFCFFFKFLPDIHIPWKTVLPGSALTGLLFTLGKLILSELLGRWNFTSAYGVAGSIIVLLFWINYSAQAMFLGAEFTKVYARHTRAVISPRSYAQFAGTPPTARRFVLWNASAGLFSLLPKIQFTWTVWKTVKRLKKRWSKE